MKTHRFIKTVSFLTALLMLFALCAVPALAADETGETGETGKTAEQRSLTDYFEKKNENGWWGVGNAINSVWVKSNDDTLGYVSANTDGYYEGWDTTTKSTTGIHHPKGIGMHSAKSATPSVTYDIDKLKVTGLKTTVFLVQYDGGTDVDTFDVDTTSEGAEYTASTMKVYFATSPDGETYTNIVEMDLTGKGKSIEVELTAEKLAGAKYLKFGLSNKNENTTSDPSASVYFADLTITQSENVPIERVEYLPSVPVRPTKSPAQPSGYEKLDSPMVSEKNYNGKPYGTWKAGDNPLYYLSDLIPDNIDMNEDGSAKFSEDSKYLHGSNTIKDGWTHGKPTTKNYPFGDSAGTPFLFGTKGMEFKYTKGFGMHPKKPTEPYKGRTDSWTVFDISDYTKEDSTTPANTFYALIGLTSAENEWGGKLNSHGVKVNIYGDKTGDGEHYEFLSCSELVIGYLLGEFNVDITGVKLLLIQVVQEENETYHGYSAIGFGDACLFLADESAVKPDYSGDAEPEKPEPDTGDDNVTTEAPTDTDAPTTTEKPDAGEESGGCASGIGVAEIALLIPAAAGAVCLCKRKKHE